MKKLSRDVIAVGLFCLIDLSTFARAVVVLNGRDVNGNLNNSGQNVNPAPFGLESLAGTFGNYLATPIQSRYILTSNLIVDGFLNPNNKSASFVLHDSSNNPLSYT